MNDEFRSAIVAARYEEAWRTAYSAGAEQMRERALIATGWKHAPGLCPDKCSACRFESALPIGAPQEGK